MPLLAKAVAIFLLAPVLATDGEEDLEKCVTRIICPFLSALVNEGILPVKDLYTREELFDISFTAGLTHDQATDHGVGNFVNIFSDTQNIFDMEGAPNEHQSSVGIHDCPTMYYNCEQNTTHNFSHCENITHTCQVPNADIFEEFFNDADTNKNDILEIEEVFEYVVTFRHTGVDFNPLASGDINGSHAFIINIFGSPKGKAISKEALKTVFLQRRFPDYFVFPAPEFDCELHTAPLQLLCSTDETGCTMNELVAATGKWTPIYTIPPSATSPPMRRMNAIGINAFDSKLYGSLQLTKRAKDPSTYFVRFGHLEAGRVVVEFLAKFPLWTYTGSFDTDENEFWYRSGKDIYVVSDVSNMSGSASPDGVKDLSELPKIHTVKKKGTYDFSDNVVLTHLVAGEQLKLFLAITDGKVYVLDVTDRSAPKEHLVTPTPPVSSELYGAAWVTPTGNAEFAANDGSGIVHVLLDTLNLGSDEVEVKNIGPSMAHSSNDGTICPKLIKQPDESDADADEGDDVDEDAAPVYGSVSG